MSIVFGLNLSHTFFCSPKALEEGRGRCSPLLSCLFLDSLLQTRVHGPEVRSRGIRFNLGGHLGSVVLYNGDIDSNVSHQAGAGWAKWKQARGVVCDEEVPINLKSKLCRAAARPALQYGSECVGQLRRVREEKMSMLR